MRGRCGFKLTQDVADERLREGWLDETLLGQCIQEDAAAIEDGGWESTVVSFLGGGVLARTLDPSSSHSPHFFSVLFFPRTMW